MSPFFPFFTLSQVKCLKGRPDIKTLEDTDVEKMACGLIADKYLLVLYSVAPYHPTLMEVNGTPDLSKFYSTFFLNKKRALETVSNLCNRHKYIHKNTVLNH